MLGLILFIYCSRVENINHQIYESQQFQLEQILTEKDELDRKVKDSITQTVNFLETGGFVWNTF